MINVLVVDDQNLTHRLMKTYLQPEEEIKIVGFAENGQDALEQIRSLQPDIVLMDIEMPKMDGLAATKIITQKFPASKVLMLTVQDNEVNLSKAIENGARGYLLKTTTAQELKNAIHYVNQGYFQLSVELTEKYLQRLVRAKPESRETYELQRKVNYLYKYLGKLEKKLGTISTEKSEEELERKVEQVIQTEMIALRDRDSHLQFKVDRMKHKQERLEQNSKFLFKIQLGSVLLALIALGTVTFSLLN